MSNRNTGSEDIHKPFGKRRHAPGTNAGQYRVGHSIVSLAMSQATSVAHAAKIAINRFGVPRSWVQKILMDPKRNNVKLMRLVLVSKKWLYRRKVKRDLMVAKVKGGRHGREALQRELEDPALVAGRRKGAGTPPVRDH